MDKISTEGWHGNPLVGEYALFVDTFSGHKIHVLDRDAPLKGLLGAWTVCGQQVYSDAPDGKRINDEDLCKSCARSFTTWATDIRW